MCHLTPTALNATRAEYKSVAVQAEPQCVAASVQTSLPPKQIHLSSAVQTSQVTRNFSSVPIQTDAGSSFVEKVVDATEVEQVVDNVSFTFAFR